MAAFEQWMQRSGRCRNSAEAEDIRQEIRLALWEIKDVPATRDEARLIFLRLASRFESRARRQVFRQGALIDQPEELAEAIERDAVRSLALFNALEKLSDHERWLVKECKIEERSHSEVARQLGVSDHTVGNRLWRAMTKLFAILKDEEKKLEKSQKSLGLIAPLAFDFTETQRAAFHAIWTAEGRIPTFGDGPSDPPPGPPPIVPGVPPAAVAPVVSAAAGGVVSAVAVAIVLALLAVVPTSIVAIYYFWDPPRVQTATKGLRAPPTNVIEDADPVVPIYEAPLVPAPATPTSNHTPTSTPTPILVNPNQSGRTREPIKSSPPIDPEELERAHRRPTSRFLPSR